MVHLVYCKNLRNGSVGIVGIFSDMGAAKGAKEGLETSAEKMDADHRSPYKIDIISIKPNEVVLGTVI